MGSEGSGGNLDKVERDPGMSHRSNICEKTYSI